MRKFKCLIVFALLLVAGFSSRAQRIESRTDKSQYLIGDAIEYVFSVPFKEGVTQELVCMKQNSDTLELQSTKTDTIGEKGARTIRYTQRYMSFVPCVTLIGDSLVVKCSGKGGESYLAPELAQVEILSPAIDTVNAQVKDIKGLMKEPFSFKEILPLVWVLLALVAVVAGVWLLVRYLRGRKVESAAVIEPKPTVPCHIEAYERLEALRQKRLSEQKLTKQFYSELTEILWDYLDGRFSIEANEMTTFQICEAMTKCGDIPQQDFQKLKELFETADLVKFAKHSTDEFTDQELWSRAKGFVDDTKQEPMQKPQE